MFFLLLCISDFEQGHLEPWHYRNAFIIIINILIIIIIMAEMAVADYLIRGEAQMAYKHYYYIDLDDNKFYLENISAAHPLIQDCYGNKCDVTIRLSSKRC